MNKLTDKEAAYLAGFFDADGSIGIYRRGISNTPSLTIVLTNSNLDALREMHEIIGEGNIYFTESNNENHRTSGQIRITGKAAIGFVEIIGDFCMVKKDQIEVARTFIGIHHNPLLDFSHISGITEDEIVDSLIQKMKDLKRQEYKV